MSMTREELQDSARRAFGDLGLAADAEKSWSLIAEMGWLMMAVPEELGGLGLGGEAAGVIHTEIGRALVPGPGIAQLLVIEALAAADGAEARDSLLERAMGGEVMTTALAPARSDSGALSCVPDADRASHVLVSGPDRVALVPLDAASLIHQPTWDETRRLFTVQLGDASGTVLAEGEAAAALARRLDGSLAFALAGDSLGAAAALLEMTVEYLKTRRQYDRPLALFQALKHRAADMKTWLSAAEALFWSSAAAPEPDRVALGALKAHATSAAARIAEEAIQLHGGIGVTMEHPCHLFLKRVMLDAALGGDNDDWEEAAGRAALNA